MTTIIDGTAGITFPNSTVQASAGQVLQVVNATYGTLVSTTTNTFIDTGLTATITPKFANSKILVVVNQNGCAKDTNNTSVSVQLLRGVTVISTFVGTGGFTNSTTTLRFGSVSTAFLDSPATTSAITYKTQFNSNQNLANAYVNIDGAASVSTITLMEIAG